MSIASELQLFSSPYFGDDLIAVFNSIGKFLTALLSKKFPNIHPKTPKVIVVQAVMSAEIPTLPPIAILKANANVQ